MNLECWKTAKKNACTEESGEKNQNSYTLASVRAIQMKECKVGPTFGF